MTVTIPLVLVIGVVVYVCYRYLGLRVWHLLVCLLLGFLLAATSAAPQIRGVLAAIVAWLQSGGKR
jgi:hypothetical protein